MFTRQLLNSRFLAAAIIAAGAMLAYAAPSSFAAGEGDHGHGMSNDGHGHSHGHDDSGKKAGHGHSGDGHGMGGHAMAGGEPGKAADVTRTIKVIATEMEFKPNKITVKAGETVRIQVVNKGELLHELSIGTPEMQKAHQVEMQKMMDEGKLEATRMVGDAAHGHGNSTMVAPGKTEEIIWKFAKDSQLEFGCNIPGHYESGMKGKIVIN